MSKKIINGNDLIKEFSKLLDKMNLDHENTQLLTNFISPIIENRIKEEQNRKDEHYSLQYELIKAVKAKDEFLANMNHELRTPLNAILGLSEALKKNIYEVLNDRHRDALDTVIDNAYKLLDTINDILDISRIESNSLSLDLNSVNISILCRSSVNSVKRIIERKSVEINSEFFGSEEDIVYADPQRLKQVLVSILSNAVKFSNARSTINFITRVDRKRNKVSFIITDTGIGIAKSEIVKIFRPFKQIESNLSRSYEGTGIGLSLTYKLIKLHGGSISCESEQGLGTTFKIELPLEADLFKIADIAHFKTPQSPGQAIFIGEDEMVFVKLKEFLAKYNIELRNSTLKEFPDKSSVDMIFINLNKETELDILPEYEQYYNNLPFIFIAELGVSLPKIKPNYYLLNKPINYFRLSDIAAEAIVDRSIFKLEQKQSLIKTPAPKLLIAEDNLQIAKSLVYHSLKAGFQPMLARSGDELLIKLKQHKPVAAIFEPHLPILNSTSFLKTIGHNSNLKIENTIIFNSLAIEYEDRVYKNKGFNLIFNKPSDNDKLQSTLKAIYQRIKNA